MFTDIWMFLSKGGVLMIPLFVCSILSLAVIVEKIINLRTRKVLSPEVLNVVRKYSSDGDIKLVRSVCEKNKSLLSRVILIILDHKAMPYQRMKEEIENNIRQEIRSLEKYLGVLETIAAVAPILGLLGTVLGMIKVFSIITKEGVGSAASLSGGISEALLTTAFGLSVAIPTLICYNYFSGKSEDMILDIEDVTNTLVTKLSAPKDEENEAA
ncbi:MAG TPA: MotA/TolQ/ExbB proton channel family protein [Candidatus Cloacimonetes bacterium]|nr:MotA/TolQ/ExbB proton channel family protein [Candidatus Cloacimonadota bacterium]HEX38382.1 MotA/TolQ/ExbB proton channel family protein [Candidatus Cloacimonadota bacterium]